MLMTFSLMSLARVASRCSSLHSHRRPTTMSSLLIKPYQRTKSKQQSPLATAQRRQHTQPSKYSQQTEAVNSSSHQFKHLILIHSFVTLSISFSFFHVCARRAPVLCENFFSHFLSHHFVVIITHVVTDSYTHSTFALEHEHEHCEHKLARARAPPYAFCRRAKLSLSGFVWFRCHHCYRCCCCWYVSQFAIDEMKGAKQESQRVKYICIHIRCYAWAVSIVQMK